MQVSVILCYLFSLFIRLVRSEWRAIGELSTTSLKFSEVIRLEFSSEVTRWRFHYQEKRNDFLMGKRVGLRLATFLFEFQLPSS